MSREPGKARGALGVRSRRGQLTLTAPVISSWSSASASVSKSRQQIGQRTMLGIIPREAISVTRIPGYEAV